MYMYVCEGVCISLCVCVAPLFQMDEETRMSWDLNLKKLKTVDSDPVSECEVVHWVMKFPVSGLSIYIFVEHTLSFTQFPMSSREYVFVHKNWVSPQEDVIVTVNRLVSMVTVHATHSRYF